MMLSTDRRRGYAFGALTGAASALTLVAAHEGRRDRALLAVVAALVCGAASVAFEERTKTN